MRLYRHLLFHLLGQHQGERSTNPPSLAVCEHPGSLFQDLFRNNGIPQLLPLRHCLWNVHFGRSQVEEIGYQMQGFVRCYRILVCG